jgi:flavin reductase (DIM6/NTAB) family NADH-FMN oxidoreductase RutF
MVAAVTNSVECFGRLMVTDGAAQRAVSRERFIGAMGHAVTGVQVITTTSAAGPLGVTVSAVCSVSADPPLLLACIKRTNPVCAAIAKNRLFCVNILALNQTKVSDTFAGRPVDGKSFDFNCANWSTAQSGALRLERSVASFDCALGAMLDVGSHTIFVGYVIDLQESERVPLLYRRGSYGRPAALNV